MLRSRLRLLPAWLLLALCAAAPYLVALHTYPLPTFYSEYVAGGCWAALALALLAATRFQLGNLPRIVLAPALLILALFAQMVFAPPINPFFTMAATICLLGAIVACGLGARCRGIPGAVDVIVLGFLLGGLLTFAIEIAQLLRISSLPAYVMTADLSTGERRLWGNLNQPNHVASYLSIGVAGCMLLALKYRRWMIPLAIIALAFEVGMVLTFSRTAWLHLAAIGLLAGWVIHASERGRYRALKAALPMVVLFVLFALCSEVIAYANVTWHLDLPTSLGQRMEHGVSDRAPLWRHAWHMFVTHPWLGAGWGDYAWNQYIQTEIVGPVILSMNAHNVVLDTLAKAGIVGLLALVIPFTGFLYRVVKQQITPERAFFLAIVLILAAHSMLEYPLHYLFFLLPFAFALGYVDELPIRYPSARMVSFLTVVFAVGAMALMVPLWGDYRAVERLNYNVDREKGVEVYRAHGENIYAPYGQLAIASNWVVSKPMARSLAELEIQVIQFYPGAAPIQRYALSLAYLGKTDDAVIQVRRLHLQYADDYPKWSAYLTESCAKNPSDLKVFCDRLRVEGLLVEKRSESSGK